MNMHEKLNTNTMAMTVSLKVFSQIVLVGILFVSACANNTPHYISQRDPIPTMGATKAADDAPVVPVEEPKELFIRQKDLKIRRKNPVNQTGSLTDLNDPRSYLFGFERPVVVGSYIEVKIASNRSEPASAANPGSADGGKGEDKGDAKATKGADEAALLKALPNLEPAGKDKPVMVKTIKMKILERFENGDALVIYRRRSVRAGQGEEVAVTARVTADALTRLEQVTTSDLEDVEYRESTKGEIVERKSANWEDEYTLRLSGFDETKSKSALELDDKRERLKEARDKLELEIKSLSAERGTMTKERSGLLEDKAKDNQKIAELENKTAELQQKIDELTPKEEKEAAKESPDETKKTADDAKAKDSKKADATAATKEKPSPKVDDKAKVAAKDKPVAKPEQVKAKDTKKPAPKDAAKKG